MFEEVDRCLLTEEKPSQMLRQFAGQGKFEEYPFSILLLQQKIEQSRVHHPEGNVWNHTLLVVDQAAMHKAKSTDSRAFMWAALLHDIGKPATTKIRKGRITAYDHDRVGAKLAHEFLSLLTDDQALIAYVSGLVRYHMHILYVLKNLPYQDLRGMKEQVSVRDVALLGLCDRLGRGGANAVEEEKNMEEFLQKCEHVL